MRFITFSCEQRLALLADPRVRATFAHVLSALRARLGFELFARVVMPEHVHLLLRPPHDVPLDRVLVSLKLGVAKRVIAAWRERGEALLAELERPDGSLRFWQKGGGFDRNVRDAGEFTKAVRYIHLNPVERGLVERPEDWDATSVRWWIGVRDGEVECDPPPGDPRGWAKWRGFM